MRIKSGNVIIMKKSDNVLIMVAILFIIIAYSIELYQWKHRDSLYDYKETMNTLSVEGNVFMSDSLVIYDNNDSMLSTNELKSLLFLSKTKVIVIH